MSLHHLGGGSQDPRCLRGNSGSEKYDYKLGWLAALKAQLRNDLERYDQVVVMGDFNIAPHDMVISAQTTRVPVLNGHTALMSVELASDPTIEDIVKAFVSFQGRPQSENLPTAPSQPVCYVGDPLRPQPKLDVDAQGGMSITVGRLRKCPVLDFKFVVLGHNTVRGAAGAAVLNAELMRVDGLLD